MMTFGPFKDISPLSKETLFIHFPNKNACLVAKEYAKIVEISHYSGSLTVQEDYEVHNTGPQYLLFNPQAQRFLLQD
jgi:hypothetical protein